MIGKKFTLNIPQVTRPKALLFTIIGVASFAAFFTLRVYIAGVSDKEEIPKIMPLQKPLDLNIYTVVNPTVYVKTPGTEGSNNTKPASKKVNTTKPVSPTSKPIPTFTPQSSLVSNPQVIKSEKNSYYDISGSTEGQLRDQMNAKVVTSEGYPGEIFDAKVEWNIYWSYPRKIEGGLCTSGGVNIYYNNEMVLPRWTNPESGSEELRNKWNNFIKNLTAHENVHIKNSSDGAYEALAKLNSISGFSTCLELDGKINEGGNKILDAVRIKDRVFDEETNHGMNQGAVFP